jgi:hypothetical protein
VRSHLCEKFLDLSRKGQRRLLIEDFEIMRAFRIIISQFLNNGLQYLLNRLVAIMNGIVRATA